MVSIPERGMMGDEPAGTGIASSRGWIGFVLSYRLTVMATLGNLRTLRERAKGGIQTK